VPFAVAASADDRSVPAAPAQLPQPAQQLDGEHRDQRPADRGWLLTHTAFTLRYAHLYYRGGADSEGGIEFCGDDKPADLDFAYFAFTIGMCFQVSDATIGDRTIRHTALLHALVSFIYNTGILALVLNIAMSQLG
jgi:uncharacterized membrane protein